MGGASCVKHPSIARSLQYQLVKVGGPSHTHTCRHMHTLTADSVDMTVSLVVTDVTVPGVTGVTDVTLATSQTPIKITDCSVQET